MTLKASIITHKLKAFVDKVKDSYTAALLGSAIKNRRSPSDKIDTSHSGLRGSVENFSRAVFMQICSFWTLPHDIRPYLLIGKCQKVGEICPSRLA